MINVSVIVPYPELAAEVERVFQHHPMRSRISKHVRVLGAPQLDTYYEEIVRESDVLIARGYTAQRIKNKDCSLPVITLPITSYDIINAVNECVRLHQPKHIGFIGLHLAKSEAETLGSLFPCMFSAYNSPSVSEIESELAGALRDGCDAFIGGYSVTLCARKRGLPVVTIRTGESAIRQALDEAVRTTEVMRQERERTVLYSTIINSAKDGVLYVANDLRIRAANPVCARYCGDRRDLVGLSLASVFPFMTAQAGEALASGRETEDQLISHEGTSLTVNYFPIVVKGQVTGVVITFQDITRIQKLETQIRQKLSEKGLVARYRFEHIIHASPRIAQVIETARRYAQASSNILIVGETGTGKELFAQSIHNASTRKAGPFVAVNCAAIPENLLESELFGYVEGAFTGSARGGKIGLFELAHNGTLFLDEISELPLSFQSKLLRALQEREVRPVGASRVKSVDVRIIAASNCSLDSRVQQGLFRPDLYYRLVVLKLYIPPLRQRPEDIDVLFLDFLKRFSGGRITEMDQIEAAGLRQLRAHPFSGNIREMKNIAERVSIQCEQASSVTVADMRFALHIEDAVDTPLDSRSADLPALVPVMQAAARERRAVQPARAMMAESERELIVRVLARCGYNQTRAAHEMGMDRTTLWRKMRKHQIQPNGPQPMA